MSDEIVFLRSSVRTETAGKLWVFFALEPHMSSQCGLVRVESATGGAGKTGS